MNGPRIGATLACGLALIAATTPAPALGQPVFAEAESLEAMVANADLVILATLDAVLGPEGPDGIEVTLLVDETIKAPIGECYQKLRVLLPGPEPTLSRWKGQPRRILVAVREEARAAASVIDLASDDLEVMTADLTVLREPNAVIRLARETERRLPHFVKRFHTVALDVPRETILGTRWERYDGLRVAVPADERLECRAREWIRSPNVARRLEGVRALRHFPSAENIALLKPLLDDPGWAIKLHAQENEGREVRRYVVRSEAYLTLKTWGVAVDRPRLEETIEAPIRHPSKAVTASINAPSVPDLAPTE